MAASPDPTSSPVNKAFPTSEVRLRLNGHSNALATSWRCLIQPGPTGLHRFAARRVRSCPTRLQAFGGFR